MIVYNPKQDFYHAFSSNEHKEIYLCQQPNGKLIYANILIANCCLSDYLSGYYYLGNNITYLGSVINLIDSTIKDISINPYEQLILLLSEKHPESALTLPCTFIYEEALKEFNKYQIHTKPI
jgi:hypothetical protein